MVPLIVMNEYFKNVAIYANATPTISILQENGGNGILSLNLAVGLLQKLHRATNEIAAIVQSSINFIGMEVRML